MEISELKRALVEVSELCSNVKCSSCPLAKWDEVDMPYCPMHEDDDGISIHQPAFWVIDDWMEDSE